jgi:hypothetical protein
MRCPRLMVDGTVFNPMTLAAAYAHQAVCSGGVSRDANDVVSPIQFLRFAGSPVSTDR